MSSMTIKELLESAVEKMASDVHLVVNKPPIFRIHGELLPSGMATLSVENLQNIIQSMMNDKQKIIYAEQRELDFSFSCMDNYQFRVNLYHEKGSVAATIRITSAHIKSMAELGLPRVIEDLSKKRKGLIVVSGTAGSGKSTTMTFLVNLINNTRRAKIITIEDPIEYIHKSNLSLIVQREVGSDTKSFAAALKYALRQDPDVVVVGEMRDLESIAMALTTAETGHLVVTTVHAPDAVETINRIIDVYPTGQREQICAQLAENLTAVIGQMLVPGKDTVERVLATEILIATLPIRNIIRRQALVELRGQMDAEQSSGMYSYDKCFTELVRKDLISLETAREYVKNAHLFKG